MCNHLLFYISLYRLNFTKVSSLLSDGQNCKHNRHQTDRHTTDRYDYMKDN